MKRRANGEGSYFQRKDGRWVAQKYVEQLDGSVKPVWGTGKTLAAAKARLEEKTKDTAQGLPYNDKEWMVGDYLHYWAEEVQAGKIRESTLSIYRYMISRYLVPTLGKHKLKNLSVVNVRLALRALKEHGCGGATLQKCLIILAACLNCAMREEIIYRNVAQLVEMPNYTPKETAIWTAKQAMDFLSATKKHPLHVAFLLLLTFGMRRGEVLGLRWCDIDFHNGWIHVRQQIGRIDGALLARDLKTKNSRRNLPLSPVIREALLRHAEKKGIAIPAFDPQPEQSLQGTIVTTRIGTPLEPRNLARCFHGLIKRVGLPRIKLHATRHTTATMLKELKTDIKDVQLILGHANPSTTLRIYQHGTPDSYQAAILGVEKALFTE
jgi:integrase